MKSAPWHALRAPYFRGVISAHGLWFAARTLSYEQALQRALGHFDPATRVWQTPLGLIVEFATARAIDCAVAGGAPLQLRAGRLVSAAFAPSVLEAMDPSWLVLLDAGQVHTIASSECHALDFARHIALDDVEFEALTSLGTPPAPPQVMVKVVDPSAALEKRVGRDAERKGRDAAIEEWNRALHGDAEQGAVRDEGAPARARNAALRRLLGRMMSGKPWRTLGGLFSRLAAQLARLPALPAGSGAAAANAEDSGKAEQDSRPRAHWWRKFTAPMRRWFERLAYFSGFARAQAQYMQNLLSLLEQHNDLEALKHAIPLGGAPSDGDSAALRPPTPRTSLGISRRLGGGSSSLHFHEQIYNHLRRAYEAMFERLDSAGRYDEAAFVLAELMRDAARAVAYLERRGQRQLAAEVAEGRNLPADLVVRQWFIAGNRKRAIAVAVRDGAFASTIARLERLGETEAATALRALHAERLADAGHLVQAARAVKDIVALRPLALHWLALARASGECTGLAQELAWQPALHGEVTSAVVQLLQGVDSADVATRAQLARELLATPSAAARPLAAALVRQLLADSGRDGAAEHARLANALGEWVGGALAADLPQVVSHTVRAEQQLLRRRHTRTAATGDCVYDVHRFGKQWLVALGEGGVALLDRTGKRIAHFDTPAEHLVTAAHSPHVLALAKRGGVYRVSRIHAATRKSQLWTELSLHAFANTFDGEQWAVVLGDSGGAPSEPVTKLSVLDVLDEHPRVLKSLPVGKNMSVQQIRTLPGECYVIAALRYDRPEVLRYALPGWQLRSRPVCPGEEEGHMFYGKVSADEGGPLWVDYSRDLRGDDWTDPFLCRKDVSIRLGTWSSWSKDHQLLTGSGYFVVASPGHDGEVLAGSFATQRVSLEVQLDGSFATTLRLQPPWLFFGDSAGRIFQYDLQTGRELAVITPH